MQDISNTLWAYATLRHYPGAELLDSAARQAVFTIHRFKPQEVANTLWSYATLGHDPKILLLDAMAAHMAQRILHFRPQVPACCQLWSCLLGQDSCRSPWCCLLHCTCVLHCMCLLQRVLHRKLMADLWSV